MTQAYRKHISIHSTFVRQTLSFHTLYGHCRPFLKLTLSEPEKPILFLYTRVLAKNTTKTQHQFAHDPLSVKEEEKKKENNTKQKFHLRINSANLESHSCILMCRCLLLLLLFSLNEFKLQEKTELTNAILPWYVVYEKSNIKVCILYTGLLHIHRTLHFYL